MRVEKACTFLVFYTYTNYKGIQRIFFDVRLCRVFFADHIGKKAWISLRNDDVIVKILNTVK